MKFVNRVACLLLMKICNSLAEEQDIDEIMSRDPLTVQNCKSFEFDCGNKCINAELVCDGTEDCTNGADEYNDFCVVDHKNASCSYPHLPLERYDFTLNYSSKQKTKVPEYVRGIFKCKPGYFGDPVNEIISTCWQKTWEPSIMACKKTCPQINNPELEQTCYRGEQVDCNGIIWERTSVHFTCQKAHHEPSFKQAYCLQDGNWDLNPDQIECHPTCGYLSKEAVEMLNHTDFPWRVIIREKIHKSIRHFSGTLIDKMIVLTDGNLFFRSKNPNDFEILVNDDTVSWGPQKSYKIRNIHFLPKEHQQFFSPDGLSNLAILEPFRQIEYSLTVSPACIMPYSYPASLDLFKNPGIMITLGDSEELYRDEIGTMQVKSLQGICQINRDKCNKYYGKINTDLKKLSTMNLGTGLIKADKELKLYFLEGIFNNQHPETDDLLIFTFASDYIEWIDEIREKISAKNVTQSEASHNLLIILVFLSFVILIAVLFQIR